MKLPAVLSRRKISQILALDFETYWDADYTLGKGKGFHTTTEYVRSPKFHAHGVSVKFDSDKTAVWITHKDLKKYFKKVKWGTTAIVCHNTAFDAFILTQIYGVTPAYYFDTLSMARAYLRIKRNDLDTVARYFGFPGKIQNVLDSTKGKRKLTADEETKLAGYANRDTNIMWKVFQKLLPLFPDDELELVHHTIRAYVEPVLQVNKRLATKIRNDDQRQRAALMKEVGLDEKTLRSRDKFADVLREHGVEPPMKVSPTTNQPTYAFAEKDLEFQELLEHHPSERVRKLCEARLEVTSTITTSKAERLLKHADPALPIMLKYGSAHTLRWGGGDNLNPQNFPRGSDLRKCLVAPPGYTLVIVDSSQIEARMLFWLAGQWDILDDFRAKKDLYLDFASEYIYMRKLTKKDNPEERFVGKVCVLGLGYMMGWVKLGYTLESGSMGMKVVLPDTLLQKAVNGYRSRFSEVKRLWQTMKQMLEVIGGRGKETELKNSLFRANQIVLPNGMPLQYPNLVPKLKPKISDDASDDSQVTDSWTYDNGKKLYNGLLLENWDQGLARLVVAQQILTVVDRYRLALMVHDEGVFVVPKRQAKRALNDILEAFHTPPDWCPELPTAGEGVISDVYIKP